MKPFFEKYAVGIDIGGTNTKLGLININGKVDKFCSFPTEASGNNPDVFLSRLKGHVQNLLDENFESCIGIGISTHGYLNNTRRSPLVCRNTPALSGFDLVEWSEQTFGKKTILNNDLIAHALAEYYFGYGKQARRFMCMAVGTGFGVGVILDGSPLRLVGETTGDAGRIIIEPNGIKCNYGVSGSIEALVGTKNIERMAFEYYGEKKAAFDVIKLAKSKNDRNAQQIMEKIGEYLGYALASLSAIFLPEKVAITGGTAEAGEVLLDACSKKYFELMGDYLNLLKTENTELFNGVEIYLGKQRAESGIIGSVVELFFNGGCNDKLE
jgi:glucokinase